MKSQTRYRLNAKLSKKVYLDCKDHIMPKNCYNNIFNILNSHSRYGDLLHKGVWKIAYGYVKVAKGSNFLIRHCFILDENNYVIDPTLFACSGEDSREYYITFLVFKSVQSYLDAIEVNSFYPDLVHYARKVEKELIMKAFNNNLILMG